MIHVIHYSFEGVLRVEAETEDEARARFAEQDAMDLARFAIDSLKVAEVMAELPAGYPDERGYTKVLMPGGEVEASTLGASVEKEAESVQ